MLNWYEPDKPRWFSYYKNLEGLVAKYNEVRNSAANQGISMGIDVSQNTINQTIPTTYPNINVLNQIVNNFDEYKQKIDSGGSFKKARLRLSEDKRFIFSFALAGKGLFRVPEYYSEELSKTHPKAFNSAGMAASDETMVAGVVDINLVQSAMLANETVFFINFEDKEYMLRQQQKGTAYMLLNNLNAVLKKDEGGMSYADPSFYGDVSLVFSSGFKKSYIEIPKEGGEAKAVDIYIPFDLVDQNNQSRMTPSIPLILASEYFVKARIKVRLNILRAIGKTTQKNGYVSTMMVFTVKDFDEPLDWNRIGVLRGLFEAGATQAQLATGIWGYEYKEIDGGQILNDELYLATGGYGGYLTYDDQSILNGEFARYKNWMYEEAAKGNINSKLVPKPLMLLISTEGLLEKDFDNRVISNATNSTNILIRERFNQLLDLVDLYFNTKTNQVVSRIATRFEELNKSEIELKNYLIGLAGQLYRDFYPRDGVYASEQEELDNADQSYLKTVNAIKQELNNRYP
jgi:hypothetical protein